MHQYVGGSLGSFSAVVESNVEVRNEAHIPPANHADKDSMFTHGGGEGLRRHARGCDVEHDVIGFDMGGIDYVRRHIGDDLSDLPGGSMVVGQAGEMVVEGVDAGGGEYASLPHSAT